MINLYLLYGLFLVFLLILLGFILALRSEKSGKSEMLGGLEAVLFLIMMPKNDLKKDDLMQKEEKVLISQMEQVFANFLYLKKAKLEFFTHSLK